MRRFLTHSRFLGPNKYVNILNNKIFRNIFVPKAENQRLAIKEISFLEEGGISNRYRYPYMHPIEYRCEKRGELRATRFLFARS